MTVPRFNRIQLLLQFGSSGVTRVGDTRTATDGCHPIFLEKSDHFLVIDSESDDLFCCRLLTTHTFPRFYPVFFLNSTTKKFSRVSPLEGVTRGGPPLPSSLVTPVFGSGSASGLGSVWGSESSPRGSPAD